MSEQFNFSAFAAAITFFCIKYFGLTESEAEARLDQWWQKTDLDEIVGYHPFFAAGLLGNCEPDQIRVKYLVHHREIDRVWFASN